MRFVQQALNLPLDYTPETLPILDHYVRERGRDGREETRGAARPYTALYFGEVVEADPGLCALHSPGTSTTVRLSWASLLELQPRRGGDGDHPPRPGGRARATSRCWTTRRDLLKRPVEARPSANRDFYTFYDALRGARAVAESCRARKRAQGSPHSAPRLPSGPRRAPRASGRAINTSWSIVERCPRLKKWSRPADQPSPMPPCAARPAARGEADAGRSYSYRVQRWNTPNSLSSSSCRSRPLSRTKNTACRRRASADLDPHGTRTRVTSRPFRAVLHHDREQARVSVSHIGRPLHLTERPATDQRWLLSARERSVDAPRRISARVRVRA